MEDVDLNNEFKNNNETTVAAAAAAATATNSKLKVHSATAVESNGESTTAATTTSSLLLVATADSASSYEYYDNSKTKRRKRASLFYALRSKLFHSYRTFIMQTTSTLTMVTNTNSGNSTTNSSRSSSSSNGRNKSRSPVTSQHGITGKSSTRNGTTSTTSIPPPPRSESMAYPSATPGSLVSKYQYYLRQNTRAVGATMAFLTFVLVISSDYLHDARVGLRGGITHLRASSSSDRNGSGLLAGAYHNGYFSVQDSITPDGFHFGMVTDLDQLSLVDGSSSSKPKFQSHFMTGFLKKTGLTGDQTYRIQLDTANIRHLVTGHNEAGRGAEFSELTVFDNRLYTFDDRTGDVFEILNSPTGQDSMCVPRLVLTEGSGDTDKGMKWEWATVKDGELYMGSMGKEFTDRNGKVVNVNNLWIAIMNQNGQIRREDWSPVYNVVRKALNAQAPGYLIMEAANWSPALRKWVFLPRRISHEEYNDVLDEKRGGRQVVLVDADFKNARVVDLKLASTDPLKGFSSFSFVPNTGDRHILAIRSVEEDCALDDMNVCKQRSYVVVLDILTGESLSREVKVEQDWKYEGLEFFNPFVVPPKLTDA